jgi:hypothetical protein
MRDVVKLLLRPVSVLSLGLSTMGMMVRGGGLSAFRAPKRKEYRMRGTKSLVMLVIAVCAMAVTTAAATAHMFTSTGMGALTLLRNATQKFTTKFGKVECTGLQQEATITELLTEDIHATVHYTGCKAFGVTATISLALYLFLASGEVHIVKPITITASGCNMTVKPQLVWTVKYINTGKEVEIKPEVEGISYEGVGALCNGSAKEGKYEGTSVVGLAGQKVEWQ